MEELATGYGLIEGPTWDETRGLIFSDVVNGGVWCLDGGGSVSNLVPKRRGVGGIGLHQSGGLVLGGREIILQPLDGAPFSILLNNDVTEGAIGFNDLTTDARGRIWVGSVASSVLAGDPPKAAHLHCIDLDGSTTTVSDGVMLSNGLGFSPDGKTLYHSDSRSELVRAYAVSGQGEVSDWREFARVAGGIPDGLAVAMDGSVWVANANGGSVLVFESDGRLRESIPVPLPMVTSLCFGGPDLMDLYVVTGDRGGPRENCGSIYRMKAPVAGVPIPKAGVSPA